MFKNLNFKKQVLPHLIILAGFLIVLAIYFSPLVFQNKSIRSHDIVQYQGMAKEITDNRAKYGEEPFWTSAMFSGMPNTLINMDQYGNLVKPVHDLLIRLIKYPSSIILIFMISFYILMLSFGIDKYLSILGAVGYGFASWNFISLVAGHNAKLACMAYMPLVLAGLVLAYRKNKLLGGVVFALGLALQIVNNHVQITYYLAFICLVFIVTEFISALKSKQLPGFIKSSVILLVSGGIALGTHAGYFLSINEYSKYTIRGKTELKPLEENKEAVREDGLDRDYVFTYSNSWDEPLTFLIPDYYGGATVGALDKDSETAKALAKNNVDPQNIREFISQVYTYFGELPMTAGPMYIGAIICFLFVLGLLIVEDRFKWGLLTASIVGVLLSYGKNFPALNYFLFDYFPLYNKFRSVTMSVAIPQLCMSILAVLGLQKVLLEKKKEELLKPLFIAAGVTGGLALLVFIMAGTGDYSNPDDARMQLPEWLLEAIRADRKGMRTGDAIRSAFFILLAGGVIYAYLKYKIKEGVAITGLVALTLIDLWGVDKRYLNENNYEKKMIENFYTPNEADQLILQDRDPNYRVLNLNNPFNESRTSYFHKSVGGYSPAKLRRYQDLVERVISPEMETFIAGLRNREFPFDKIPVLNMLNTKYFLLGTDGNSVLPNDSALGNAWFVSQIKVVQSPDEEIATLQNFNPKQTAVLDGSKFQVSKTTFSTDTSANIRLTTFKPYDLTYESNNVVEGFGVFSEVYYPKGWTATIDGKEVEIKRVNYVLRGLEIPAGKHTIRFVMKNEAYSIGNTIGLICSLLLYGALGFGLFMLSKKEES